MTKESLACTEFTEDLVEDGARRKLRRGQGPSGNEMARPEVIPTKVKLANRLRTIKLHSKLAGRFLKEDPEMPLPDARVINLQTIQNIGVQIKVTSPLLAHRIGAARRAN